MNFKQQKKLIMFYNFLKEHNVFEKFFKYYQTRNNKNLLLKDHIDYGAVGSFFILAGTEEGTRFWENLSQLWRAQYHKTFFEPKKEED